MTETAYTGDLSVLDAFREGWSGHSLPVWCRELGLRDIQVEPFTR